MEMENTHKKKGNKSVKDQERVGGKGGGFGRPEGVTLKWAGSERPAVIEGEKWEYKFPTSCCQRHFLSQPCSESPRLTLLPPSSAAPPPQPSR